MALHGAPRTKRSSMGAAPATVYSALLATADGKSRTATFFTDRLVEGRIPSNAVLVARPKATDARAALAYDPHGCMPFAPGTRLGRYEITSALGAGGMGEVYGARDTTLNRAVAIKVLPDLFAADSGRLARFEREAQLLASLNHPHIAQVYGYEDLPAPGSAQPAVRALVMELVDGPTLADRIARGAVPLDETLPIARQIAAALAAAHERGIVHRDLKPANVKLTAGGAVKVLDFGLAKALEPLSPLAGSPAAMDSPTFASPVTQSGVILGTAAYMAPEQARGKIVDKRADIWALGVVLYEMVAGRPPFDGETISDTIAAVLRQDVDWTRLPADTPDGLRRLLRRCLERDPADRLHDAADVRLSIDDAQREDRRPAAGHPAARTRTPWLLAGLMTAAAAVAGALAVRSWAVATPRGDLASPIVRFAIEPPPGVTNVSYVALAADGRFAVFEAQVEGEFRFFMRRLDTLESRPLAGTEGARGPFISPDGRWIGFVRNAKIYKISTEGGDALAVCNVQGGPGATWNDDGRIIFSRAWLSGLSIVSADGGTPAALTTPDHDSQEIGHWWPAALPNGHVLFTIVRASTGLNDARIALLDLSSRTYRVLFPGAKAAWLSSGYILFYRSGRYHAVAFDAASGTVTGEAFPVLEDAQELDPAGDWGQPVAAARSGALAYLPGRYVPPSRLTWIDAAGTFAPLPFAPRPFIGVKLSPDGRRVATASVGAGRLLIRVMDLERGTEEMPNIDGMNWNPVWLPDGRLSFTSMRKGDFDVYVKEVGGTGAEHAVLAGQDDTDPIAWTRDGRLIFQGSEPDGTYPLKLFDPRQPTHVTRLTEQHVDNGGALSPDERWLAYQSAAIGRSVVYVRPLTAPGPAVALSRDSGEFPIFLHDGKTLALVRGQQLVVRSWRDNRGRFEIGPERVVAPLAFGSGWTYGAPYDVARDGRFLALVRTEASPAPRIRVVLGWDREVTRLRAQVEQ
jgi:serine/threonine-protein kinase